MGLIIMVVCCWGSAGLFCGIGLWAEHCKKPIHFWSGTKIDPETVTDIPAYNHANAVMWELYSIPYWLAGVCSFYSELCAGILIMLASVPGLAYLFWQYGRIEKEFIKKP